MTVKTRGTASQAAPRTGTAGSRLRTTTIPLGTHGKGPHNSTQGWRRARATHPTTRKDRAHPLARATHPPPSRVIRAIQEATAVDHSSTQEDTPMPADPQAATLIGEGPMEDTHPDRATPGRQEDLLLLAAHPRHPHTPPPHNPTSNTRREWVLGMGRPRAPPTQAPWPPRVPG